MEHAVTTKKSTNVRKTDNLVQAIGLALRVTHRVAPQVATRAAFRLFTSPMRHTPPRAGAGMDRPGHAHPAPLRLRRHGGALVG